VLLCDDGSEEAATAVREAGGLLREHQAIALHVWQQLSTVALTGVGAGMPAARRTGRARENDVAVIVLGARGLSGLQQVLLGSVSERVVRHADRPVLVLRQSPGSS
jgi:nucleotide-binding universal stress UspA family protein